MSDGKKPKASGGISEQQIDCFVIMPIADPDGYPSGHFKHVYDDLIAPACKMAGVEPIRADDIKAANLIHLDILRRLLDAPIAICDLSSRNPNVLFELGVRQAFDKPVVLIQEAGTPRIFDISPLRCIDYSRELKYHDVVSSQAELASVIEETIKAASDKNNINSIVKLLGLTDAAKIPDLSGDKESMEISLMMNELRQLSKNVDRLLAAQKEAKPSLATAISAFGTKSIVDEALAQANRDLNQRSGTLVVNPLGLRPTNDD